MHSYDDYTVEQCDVRIISIHQTLTKIQKRIDIFEKNPLFTGKRLKKETEPLVADRKALEAKLINLDLFRDSLIPAHEKIDKNSVMYKHLIQTFFNKKIDDAARERKDEDKKMLQEIGDGILKRK